VLPFHHQHLIAGLIDDLLQNSTDFAKDENLLIRRLNFSGVKGQTKVGKSGLHYCSNKVTLVLSSDTPRYIELLINELFRKRYILIGKLNVSPEKVEEEEFSQLTSQTKFLCISPIVLSTKPEENIEEISLYSDVLSDLLYDSTMQKIESLGLFKGESLESFSNFQVVPDQEYISKALNNNKKISRLYRIKDRNGEKQEYRGYTFPFKLYAHEKIQKLVLECGFGEFADLGFGMLDVVNKKTNLKELQSLKGDTHIIDPTAE